MSFDVPDLSHACIEKEVGEIIITRQDMDYFTEKFYVRPWRRYVTKPEHEELKDMFIRKKLAEIKPTSWTSFKEMLIGFKIDKKRYEK